ncbi:MAG: pyridoxal phosphate-dependent aminotransferase [Anaerolineae bacterium]|nr:pyridoxal phosphate-dependent aminotransferase [Anaerolineae bacterium]
MQLAPRMNRLGTETAFDILARAKSLEAQGRDIIHLEIGEPDFDTPPHIVEAAVLALHQGHTHYTPAAGIPALRQAIASHVGRSRNVAVQPEQVVVTPGAKPIMFFIILALLGPGDEAIYPNPGFPIYESMINFVGAKPVALPLREKKDFRFNPDEFRSLVSERTRLIILNSPQNPTGGVLSLDDLEVVAGAAREYDLMVLSDEVYNQILYQGEHVSILSLPGMQPRTILLDGFSKTYAMTGWRLGYGVMPVALAEQVTKLMVNSNSCTAAFTQHAGIAALHGPQDSIGEMVTAFRERREVIVSGLNQIPGFRCPQPAGAFYAFPNVEGTGMSSKALADYLLETAGVAALDGGCFGRYGEGYLRFSYANSVANIQRALERIDQAVRVRL